MTFNVGLSYLAAIVTAGIAVMALYRDPRSFVHRVFAAGMILFAVDAGLTGFLSHASSPEAFISRGMLQLICASLLPSVWLLFSVSFARANYSEQISNWKWVLILSFAIPVSMVTLFKDAFFAGMPVLNEKSVIYIPIGWSGYAWHLFWVISSVLILMNLERTFRHATGHMRWQTKFMFLGLGAIFGVHLFTDSQVLLFRGVNTDMSMINPRALLVADFLVFRSLFRGKPLSAGIHLSHQFLYNSFTTLIVGVYFISVGIFAWLSVRFEWISNIHLVTFLVFVAVIGIASLLLSDRLRVKRKRFISRHFKRPQYDYQKIWENFTNRTASVTQTKDLCNIIVKMVSETMEILSVSIWLVDEKQERLSFGGSSVFTDAQADQMKLSGGGTDIIRAMTDQTMPVDLEDLPAGEKEAWVEELNRTYGAETRESRIRYCVPLNAAGRLIGIMTLSEKVFYEPLSFEESELVRTIAGQAAASLMNLRLSEHLREVKELEAFQSMSAFFMHDLKNLASKLSLVTQNLPLHIDNPDFRADALKTISQSVSKINNMSSRLSLLSQRLEIYLRETDINQLAESAVSGLKEYIKVPVSKKFKELAPVSVDPEQIHKVLENLLMNACDSLGPDGQIIVETDSRDNWAEIIVRDNGCGMSPDFIANNLFRPFRTTKKQGMGIGLYHCKTIVEAHGGRIEAESGEGKGTAFRVLLPMAKTGVRV